MAGHARLCGHCYKPLRAAARAGPALWPLPPDGGVTAAAVSRYQGMSIIEADRQLLTQARASGGHQAVVDTFIRILSDETDWPDERIQADVRLILDMREEALGLATSG